VKAGAEEMPMMLKSYESKLDDTKDERHLGNVENGVWLVSYHTFKELASEHAHKQYMKDHEMRHNRVSRRHPFDLKL
jgi:hypothetical protein